MTEYWTWSRYFLSTSLLAADRLLINLLWLTRVNPYVKKRLNYLPLTQLLYIDIGTTLLAQRYWHKWDQKNRWKLLIKAVDKTIDINPTININIILQAHPVSSLALYPRILIPLKHNPSKFNACLMNTGVDDDRLKNLSICVIMRQFFIPKWCVISAKI